MSPTKPTILIIPGSFTPPTLYSTVTTPLSQAGYSIRALQLPTIGRKPCPPPTMQDDAAFIHAEVTKLADKGKDVLLVSHSYSGVPASEASKGLSKAEREKEGKKGGVVRLAYIAALMPAVGESCASLMKDAPKLGHVSTDEDGWMTLEPVESAKYNFSDLPAAEGQAWAKRFSDHSAVSFAGELTHPGYKYVPVSYLLCEADQTVPPSLQQKMIDYVAKESGREVDVRKINTGHLPNASAPEKVTRWIIDIAQT